MVLGIHITLCMTELDFLEKNFCPNIWENGPKRAKTGIFIEFIDRFGHYFLLNWFYNQNLYCYIPAEIPHLGKFLFLIIWGKMLSANQIARFFNQPYLQNK